ncbi:putative NRPS-like enzyme [Aspergillus clavatus NRRL 1]|uniref:NRPS-like enzyme, putative n=1 Tax=Aspergillus clavatus (strain ATCC 1007 / CBS 513.65 / DSM 816 / NCTC 3887 / NRRL 1 / QM 1276 / 107) TaxID=344612 RepID=A1C8U4_ASPCL|nr:NRPS-like enzyme, putative [Aspergillus clavatus NRRL 1]EAW13731.1 NRPS-like enzyme, putative [Aspergillus clavatus NRRL 1]
MESSFTRHADGILSREFGFGPQRAIPYPTAHHAFLHHALEDPGLLALHDLSEGAPREVSYGKLLQYAQFVTLQLQKQGVTAGSRVVLVTKRGLDMVAGILGILMCGAQYIPLDGAVVPDQTLEHALAQSESRVVLCSRSFQHRISSNGQVSSILLLEDLVQEADRTGHSVEAGQVICQGDENSGCYVIFTSGTTGTPKGVDVTHKNVTNVVCQSPGNLGISRGSKVGQVLSISFDMGAWEILGSLSNGATLVLRGSDWHAALRQIDTLICTPSILNRYRPEDYPNIRCIATAGEPCPQSLADKWAANGVDFYNCCGPTEVTIINTMHRHHHGQPLTIGQPLPNNNVYILDDEKNPVKFGEIGTVWAGGMAVTRGYLGLYEKTVERYHYDPFVNDSHSQMFNTGDLARWLPDGNLEMLGRKDDQVKIKGFRVELDGVSASLAACPGVKRAAALLVEGQLIGFLTPKSCNVESIRTHLSKLLPYYATPSEWHAVEAFPLTPNGKIDKYALTQQFHVVSETSSVSTSGALGEKKAVTQSSTDPSTSVNLGSCESLQKPVPLPVKKDGKLLRGLRYRIFIVYRRLFTLVWLANIAALLCIVLIPAIDRQWISILAYINLTIAVLVRQDAVINILYTACCSVPKSWPLAIRKRCAKIYHLGGVHSGAAIAATCWFAGSIGYNISRLVREGRLIAQVSPATLTLSVIVLSLLFGMIASAYPALRKARHNTFESIHRFVGWTVLTIIWVQTMLSIRDQTSVHQSLGRQVLISPKFWMLVVITLSIASSWAFLKRVPVDAEVLSNHAVRLHFDYTMPVNGTFTRLSQRPLLEWHSFATVPAPVAANGRPKGYSLVVSRAGDWTGRQISNPPTHFWTRGIPTCGVMRIATLFNKVVLVGTGSGIGPLLGHIQVPTCPFRLVWSTSNPEVTFGKDMMAAVYGADPHAVVHDTKKQGRPDLVQLTWDAVQSFGAEAVIVISNEKLTKKVVYGMETRGVPAYGAIWDS